MKAAYYRGRDLRTEQILGRKISRQWLVHIGIDDDMASTAAGQLLLLALSNQLARIYRRITFSIPDVPSIVPIVGLAPVASLRAAVLSLVQEVDPYGRFGCDAPSRTRAVTVAIGNPPGLRYGLYLGIRCAIGLLSTAPLESTARVPGAFRGAAVASCLGAAAVLRHHLGLPFRDNIELSGWNYREGHEADPGPNELPILDMGSTLLIGAGAVASALSYWLAYMGVAGSWYIIDGDRIQLHNTNRSLLFLPRHAGWKGSAMEFKADVLASTLPNALSFTGWYDECHALADQQFDVVLCLANERDVRTRVAQRLSTVVLHATTGRDWLSILHRHIAGKDDCIRCRTRDMKTPDFACSTARVRNPRSGQSQDASLPFLSAASGLMLATALQKLQMGVLDVETMNEWRWDLASAFQIAQCGRRQCLDGCEIAATPGSIRREINKGLKWAYLDTS